jgi:hypothetical protein
MVDAVRPIRGDSQQAAAAAYIVSGRKKGHLANLTGRVYDTTQRTALSTRY